MNNVQNSVIHQKGMLSKKNNQKFRPLLLAMFAGKNATTIQTTKNITVQIVVIVKPNNDVANI